VSPGRTLALRTALRRLAVEMGYPEADGRRVLGVHAAGDILVETFESIGRAGYSAEESATAAVDQLMREYCYALDRNDDAVGLT